MAAIYMVLFVFAIVSVSKGGNPFGYLLLALVCAGIHRSYRYWWVKRRWREWTE